MGLVRYFLQSIFIYSVFFIIISIFGYSFLYVFSKIKPQKNPIDPKNHQTDLFLSFGVGVSYSILLTYFLGIFPFNFNAYIFKIILLIDILFITSLIIFRCCNFLRKEKLSEESLQFAFQGIIRRVEKINFKRVFFYLFQIFLVFCITIVFTYQNFTNDSFTAKDPYFWQGLLFDYLKHWDFPRTDYQYGFVVYLSVIVKSSPIPLNYLDIHYLLKFIPTIHILLILFIIIRKFNPKPASFYDFIIKPIWITLSLFIFRYMFYRMNILVPTILILILIIIFLPYFSRNNRNFIYLVMLCSSIFIHPLNSIYIVVLIIGFEFISGIWNVFHQRKFFEVIKKQGKHVIVILLIIFLFVFLISQNQQIYYNLDRLGYIISYYTFNSDPLENFSNLANFIWEKTSFLISISGYYVIVLFFTILIMFAVSKIKFSKLSEFLIFGILITALIAIIGEIMFPILFHFGIINFNLKYHLRLIEISSMLLIIFSIENREKFISLVIDLFGRIRNRLKYLISNIKGGNLEPNSKNINFRAIRSYLTLIGIILNVSILLVRPPIIDYHFSSEQEAFIYPLQEYLNQSGNSNVSIIGDKNDPDLFYLILNSFSSFQVLFLDLNQTVENFNDTIEKNTHSGDIICLCVNNINFEDINEQNGSSSGLYEIIFKNSYTVVFEVN